MSVKLMPGGSTSPRYVLPLLFFEKSQKLLITHQSLKLDKKSTDLESFELYIFLKFVFY
jgi:hypothetical protein